MNTSGVLYWKVDYGDHEHDEQWRHHLSDLGRSVAPLLTIETAKTPGLLSGPILIEHTMSTLL